MTAPMEEDWRKVSDQIINVVGSAPPAERLRVFKEQLALLPDDSRRMVEHFVSLTMIFSSQDTQSEVVMSKHFHLSVVSGLTFVVALVLIGGGIYLVSMAGDDATSKIDMFGAAVETNSVGVACFALSAFMFLLTIRSVTSKM